MSAAGSREAKNGWFHRLHVLVSMVATLREVVWSGPSSSADVPPIGWACGASCTRNECDAISRIVCALEVVGFLLGRLDFVGEPLELLRGKAGGLVY